MESPEFDLASLSGLTGRCPAQDVCEPLGNLRNGCTAGISAPTSQVCLVSVVLLLGRLLDELPSADADAA